MKGTARLYSLVVASVKWTLTSSFQNIPQLQSQCFGKWKGKTCVINSRFEQQTLFNKCKLGNLFTTVDEKNKRDQTIGQSWSHQHQCQKSKFYFSDVTLIFHVWPFYCLFLFSSVLMCFEPVTPLLFDSQSEPLPHPCFLHPWMLARSGTNKTVGSKLLGACLYVVARRAQLFCQICSWAFLVISLFWWHTNGCQNLVWLGIAWSSAQEGRTSVWTNLWAAVVICGCSFLPE